MGYQADNAVIMAAGLSSRFAPLSYEKPKALIPVRGEVLIERQIRQLREAGIPEIYVVTGYKSEQFQYLEQKWNVKLIHNPEYLERNNNGSIYAARDVLKNSYLCSADNYFTENPFTSEVEDSYYAAVYSEGETKEWCMKTDEAGWITDVSVGGRDSWYMMGHTFWSEAFTETFLEILEREYQFPETREKLWEDIYLEHLDLLPMKLRPYETSVIFEFDSLDELRQFDPWYQKESGSRIMRKIAELLRCEEREIEEITPVKQGNLACGMSFICCGIRYVYDYEKGEVCRENKGGENESAKKRRT